MRLTRGKCPYLSGAELTPTHSFLVLISMLAESLLFVLITPLSGFNRFSYDIVDFKNAHCNCWGSGGYVLTSSIRACLHTRCSLCLACPSLLSLRHYHNHHRGWPGNSSFFRVSMIRHKAYVLIRAVHSHYAYEKDQKLIYKGSNRCRVRVYKWSFYEIMIVTLSS